MNFQELEEISQKLLNIICKDNDIYEETTDLIEEILPLYSQYYKDYPNLSSGQFISDKQIDLFMAYIKVFTVPILITKDDMVKANASGVLLDLDQKFLITNFHVYEQWRKLNEESKTFFLFESISLPVEDLIIDVNRSLDLISILVPDELYKLISTVSYKKFFTPNKWPYEAERGTIVIASGYPGKMREDYADYTHLHHGSVAERITDLTESKYIVPFNRNLWEPANFGVKDVSGLTNLGGFSGGPVFSFDNRVVNLVGIIFEDGGNFFDGIRVIRSSLINTDGTFNNEWGY